MFIDNVLLSNHVLWRIKLVIAIRIKPFASLTGSYFYHPLVLQL